MYSYMINIENQLKKICSENEEYAELWSTWNLNKKTLNPILDTIIKDYPHFSYHDKSHSKSILLNIERLLGNKNIEKLSPTDLWLILHVAYLHDFGMVVIDTKIHDVWGSIEFQDFIRELSESNDKDLKEAANTIISFDKTDEKYDVAWPLNIKKSVTILISHFCRKYHGEYSREYILDIENIWGIDLGHNGLVKNRLISLIGDISVIHTKPFSDVMKLNKESNGLKNDYIHPRLVACLLRMGDVLDLDNSRFNPYGETIFGEFPSVSKLHFNKHEATKHILITNEIIEVEADCNSDALYRETRKWLDLLKDEVNNLRLLWNDIAPNEFGRPPKLAACKILKNGIEDNAGLSDLRFRISSQKAFEILEGSAIYKSKFACLREIIQNAEDASKIQLWTDIKNGMYYCDGGIEESKVNDRSLLPNDIPSWVYKIYAIRITVEPIENKNCVVKIEDHGTGISIRTIKDICNVGESYFSKKHIYEIVQDMPLWLRPTANFGIGLQSCFMATDRFIINTNSNVNGQLRITFESGKEEGYVSVEPGSEYTVRGSQVVIEISESEQFRFNAFGFTAQNLFNLEPFASNNILVYRIIEEIFNECNSSFFDIDVCSSEIGFEQSIPSCFGKDNKEINFSSFEKYHGKYPYFISEDKKTFAIWYKDNLFRLNIQKPGIYAPTVSFKGKAISKSRLNVYNHPDLSINVDIYSIPTKEALSLNRDELSQKAVNDIKGKLEEVIGIFIDLLEKNANEIKCNATALGFYFLNAWNFNRKVSADMLSYLPDEKNIHQVYYNEEEKKYIHRKISLRDIGEKYPNLNYINIDIEQYEHNTPHRLSIDNCLQQLNESQTIDKSKFKEIIVDNSFKRYLDRRDRDVEYIDSSEFMCIYSVRTNDELFIPNDYTRKELIKRLVYNKPEGVYYNSEYTMRRAIPAFKDYKELATIITIPFMGVEDYYSRWHIISPISKEDKTIIDRFSKEGFVNYIVERPMFDSIVEYMLKNDRKYNASKEDIISSYKKLIREYYNLIVKP